jgi:DNA helicase-2/ATP-dependent DNA helicase PcrA
MDVSYLLDSLNDEQRGLAAPRSNMLVLAGAGRVNARAGAPYRLVTDGREQLAVFDYGGNLYQQSGGGNAPPYWSDHGTSQGGMWVGTFHGLAHRLLRARTMDANLPQDFQILDSEDQLRLLKRLIKAMNLDEKQCTPRQAMWFINSRKTKGCARTIMRAMQPAGANLQRKSAYQEACDRAGLVDFAELLLRAHELWLNKPHILQHYRERFTNILVDEFRIPTTFSTPGSACWRATGKVMIGDDDQSIYGWRGAQVENIQRFLTDFRAQKPPVWSRTTARPQQYPQRS